MWNALTLKLPQIFARWEPSHILALYITYDLVYPANFHFSASASAPAILFPSKLAVLSCLVCLLKSSPSSRPAQIPPPPPRPGDYNVNSKTIIITHSPGGFTVFRESIWTCLPSHTLKIGVFSVLSLCVFCLYSLWCLDRLNTWLISGKYFLNESNKWNTQVCPFALIIYSSIYSIRFRDFLSACWSLQNNLAPNLYPSFVHSGP